MTVEMNVGLPAHGQLDILHHLSGVHLDGDESLHPLREVLEGRGGKGEKRHGPEEPDFEALGPGQSDGGLDTRAEVPKATTMS